jgi:hypothetical protein
LVISIPAPSRDHGENEEATVAEQVLITIPIALADGFGHVGKIEFDWPTAARLEVYEQQSALRDEHVAWVRLTVQQLFGRTAVTDRSPRPSQCVAQKLPVGVGECWCEVGAPYELLSLLNSICEMRGGDIEHEHAGMQPRERIRVVGR